VTGTRGRKTAAPATSTAVALAHLLAIAAAGCGEEPAGNAFGTGRGFLVSPYAETASCTRAVYRGPETALYSNRPYHTAERVEAAAGLGFCRGARHGTNVWIVEISRPTALVAFGSASFGLERRGWTPSDEALLVAAAGLPLDRIYTKRFAPGRYVIRQGFTNTAPLVFWDREAVRLAP
jgi:hypothetical protein